MVNTIEELLRHNVASPPPDHLDLGAVVDAGRRRVRRRRGLVSATALAAAAAVAIAALTGVGPGSGPDVASNPDGASAGPVVTLDQARPAVRGQDYEVVTSYTNDDLDRPNGQYLSGVTDDGLVVVVQGPIAARGTSRVGLLDPTTEQTDWQPGSRHLGRLVGADAERLTFVSERGKSPAVAVLDRATRTWSEITWPGLPDATTSGYGEIWVESGRAWISIPRGGDWQRFDVWSMSLTEPDDVREEQPITAETTDEPDAGDQLVVGGTASPIVTIRGGAEVADITDRAVVVLGRDGDGVATYVYVRDSGELLRLADEKSTFSSSVHISGDYVAWDTPANGGHGATQWLGRLLP